MSDEIKKLDKKGLRDFGLLIGGLIAVLFGLAVPLLRRHSLPLVALGSLRSASAASIGGAEIAESRLSRVDALWTYS
jgi:hypothetical protein